VRKRERKDPARAGVRDHRPRFVGAGLRAGRVPRGLQRARGQTRKRDARRSRGGRGLAEAAPRRSRGHPGARRRRGRRGITARRGDARPPARRAPADRRAGLSGRRGRQRRRRRSRGDGAAARDRLRRRRRLLRALGVRPAVAPEGGRRGRLRRAGRGAAGCGRGHHGGLRRNGCPGGRPILGGGARADRGIRARDRRRASLLPAPACQGERRLPARAGAPAGGPLRGHRPPPLRRRRRRRRGNFGPAVGTWARRPADHRSYGGRPRGARSGRPAERRPREGLLSGGAGEAPARLPARDDGRRLLARVRREPEGRRREELDGLRPGGLGRLLHQHEGLPRGCRSELRLHPAARASARGAIRGEPGRGRRRDRQPLRAQAVRLAERADEVGRGPGPGAGARDNPLRGPRGGVRPHRRRALEVLRPSGLRPGARLQGSGYQARAGPLQRADLRKRLGGDTERDARGRHSVRGEPRRGPRPHDAGLEPPPPPERRVGGGRAGKDSAPGEPEEGHGGPLRRADEPDAQPPRVPRGGPGRPHAPGRADHRGRLPRGAEGGQDRDQGHRPAGDRRGGPGARRREGGVARPGGGARL
ncbi:MAG: hypothetical protein AVDCRST_MAG01-01-5032, partial [uncultured Rubrobacteraceae bacterium]